MNYKKIPTSAEVWAVIRARHPDMAVFSTYSAPNGEYGSPDIGEMMTEYGFRDADYPTIGARTRWGIDPNRPGERINETHTYWLCAAKEARP